MKYLRGIVGKTQGVRVRSERIRDEFQQIKLRERAMKIRLRWFGLVKRMGEGRLPCMVEERQPMGTRSRGRPRRGWKGSMIQ